jgi:hypothetical protein
MLILPIVFVRPFSMGHRSAAKPFKNLSFLPPTPKPAKPHQKPSFFQIFPVPRPFFFIGCAASFQSSAVKICSHARFLLTKKDGRYYNGYKRLHLLYVNYILFLIGKDLCMKRNAKFCLTLLLVSAVCLSGMTISGLAQEEPVTTEEALLVTDATSADAVVATPTPTPSYTTDTSSDAIIKGDVNGDGSVNLKDVTSLFQYVNKQTSTVKQPAAADVNGDGVLNLMDVTKLFQYVNKQISTL